MYAQRLVIRDSSKNGCLNVVSLVASAWIYFQEDFFVVTVILTNLLFIRASGQDLVLGLDLVPQQSYHDQYV